MSIHRCRIDSFNRSSKEEEKNKNRFEINDGLCRLFVRSKASSVYT